ncbi:RNA polymerase II-associated protein 3-like isoform X2 [Stegodyphus dumicola]|uniref:RNA polymerase II-associated protein 3-like isoform X2 n=1 Tax=Stegodyphus dumicola TaxID=202533 RepID=UPI0015AE2323|nr:RNA polymerase II-associated protein 3-like isoform X2 [Stegodyphus dumicola]
MKQTTRVTYIIKNKAFPPIRNSLSRSKKKGRHKKKERNISSQKDMETKNEADEETKHSSPSDNSDQDEEMCLQKKKQLAILNKDKGNEFFKKGNYDSAINCYTTGMQLDPDNPLLPANRAMAFLKKEQFQAAENDCTSCLAVDPTYVKAYLRRGTARSKLKKYSLAREDFSKALELEPENKQAQLELKKLKECPSPISDDQKIESEVLKTQDFWPQFVGNKNIIVSEEMHEDKNHLKASTSKESIVSTTVLNTNDDSEQKQEETKMASTKKANNSSENPLYEIGEIISKLEQSLPPVPSASFQFLTDWTKISKYPDLKYRYLKQFPPEKFPVVFKYSMEAEIFPEILHTLSTSFLDNGDDVFDYLKYLTAVGRFNTMLMFLSNSEKKNLQKLLDVIKSSDRSSSEKDDILNLYKV